MAIIKQSQSPLGVYYESPLKVRRSPAINMLLMLFVSSIRDEDAGDEYPIFNNMWDGSFASQLSALKTVIALHQASRVCIIGVKRSGAYNNASGASYETGIEMAVPDGWLDSDGDLSYWCRLEEWEPGGNPGASPANSLTIYDLMEWFENSTEEFGMPTQVVVEMLDDCGSMTAGVIRSPVSPWSTMTGVTLSSGLPAIPQPPGTEEFYYNIIQEEGDADGFEACEEFYDYLESSEVGINTIGRFTNYRLRNFGTPGGQVLDRVGSPDWAGYASTIINANVPFN